MPGKRLPEGKVDITEAGVHHDMHGCVCGNSVEPYHYDYKRKLGVEKRITLSVRMSILKRTWRI